MAPADTDGGRRFCGRVAAMTLTAVVVMASLIVPVASADQPTLASRGIEAAFMTGGKTVADAAAPDGKVLILKAGSAAVTVLDTVAARGLVVTASTRCRHAVMRLRVGAALPTMIRVRRSSWRVLTVSAPIAAGSHGISLRLIRSHEVCRSVRLDRIDVIPSKDRVLLGAALRAASATSDGVYRQAFLDNFDSLTPENELKMETTEPQQGRFDFSAADSLVTIAVGAGKAVRGHALVYGDQLPAWVTHPLLPWTRAGLLDVMQTYIDTVMAHYRSRIDTYDVVNEGFNDDGTLRHNVWLDVIGPDYIEYAFRRARRADPKAKLMYNDIATETDGPKQRAILAMAADFRRRGVPIDGVGLQNHTNLRGYPSRDELKATMTRFAGVGLGVEITEMDVGTLEAPGTQAARLARQAQAYRQAATACWDIAACTRLTTWGVSDALSWIGTSQQPLLLDASYHPKPALAAVDAALHRGA